MILVLRLLLFLLISETTHLRPLPVCVLLQLYDFEHLHVHGFDPLHFGEYWMFEKAVVELD